MKKYCVVAISRQYCSGGQDIAKKLAEELNVPYYDKEIITLASKESGLAEEAIRESKKTAHRQPAVQLVLDVERAACGRSGIFGAVEDHS